MGLGAALCAGMLLASGCTEQAPTPEQHDQEALVQLSVAGHDLSVPRTFEHSLLFGHPARAEEAAAALQQLGYRVQVKRSATAPPEQRYLVIASTEVVPSAEYLKKARESFEAAAKQLSGLYAGFELQLRPAGADGGA